METRYTSPAQTQTESDGENVDKSNDSKDNQEAGPSNQRIQGQEIPERLGEPQSEQMELRIPGRLDDEMQYVELQHCRRTTLEYGDHVDGNPFWQ